MRKRRVMGALAALAAIAAIAVVGASVAEGSSASAPATAAPTTPFCFSQALFSPVAALKEGSGRERDLVPNQYDLPTPDRGVLPFFTPPVTINVYFHVIMNGPDTGADDDSTGDIPQSWIADQITQLNNAYSGGEGGADTGFHFALAGTDRTDNPLWFDGLVPGKNEKAMKKALRRGGYFDLNVYTADLGGGLLGWATFPVKKGTGAKTYDGIVIYHESLPGGNADFGTDAKYNEGDTLTHEAGHWLGLYHTFQGGCSTKNDQVDDTPAHLVEFDCTAQDSCPSLPGTDPIHNYMNYTDDVCMTEFTPGQRDRAQAIWDVYRGLPPTVKKAKPNKGPVGTVVTIGGGNLSDATAVFFNGTAATTFSVDSDGQITATVPVGTPLGKGFITVQGPYGTSVAKKTFTVKP